MLSNVGARLSYGSLPKAAAVARFLDIAITAGGAVAAALMLPDDTGQRVVQGTCVALDVALVLTLFPVIGLYNLPPARSRLRRPVALLGGWAAVQACSLGALFLLYGTVPVSLPWFGLWTLCTAVGLVAARIACDALRGRAARTRRAQRRVAIIGAGTLCSEVADRARTAPASGFRVVDVLICGDTSTEPALQGLREFIARVHKQDIEEVWLALPLSETRAARCVLAELSDALVTVRLLPDVRGMAMLGGDVVNVLGNPAINLMASPLASTLLRKVVFDRLFAAAALAMAAPLLAAIAVAVKLSSKGPVIFSQARRGVDGRVFRIYKFRTMRAHAVNAGVLKQATCNDPRITRVGAFLRRTSLDELPQFINVLRGEMSVVGPRPHALEHDDQYRKVVDGYIHRYRIKPGITGWAQVNGFRGETDRVEKMRSRVEYDLYYLKNWSFWLDMRIVLATVVKGMRHRNAY
jgi:Undecaprenyl-phosphate glucose phosphotransferase